jgi:hypothetical protein
MTQARTQTGTQTQAVIPTTTKSYRKIRGQWAGRLGRGCVTGGLVAGLLTLAGCSVNVNKGADGQDKDVAIHTPFGGMEVHNKGGVVDTGLAAYPGAVLNPGKDGNSKSVDMHMGFGAWQIKIQVASYISQDSQMKLEAFYRKQLSQYGKVLTCKNNEPVGTPTVTEGGLTCQDKTKVQGDHVDSGNNVLELKAGSNQRQHIVALKSKGADGTHFQLISLVVPGDDKGGNSEE